LEYDGNLIDASSIAVNAALMTTKYSEMKMEDGKAVATGKMLKLPIKNIAIEHTVSKIGESLIIDANLREEFVQDCRLTMAVDQNENFTALQKGGGSGPMSLDLIDQAMGMALDSSKTIKEKIDEAVKDVE
jgi:exosome complex component RRP42